MATRSHEQEKTKAALVRSYPEHTQLATHQKTFLRTLLLTPLARRAAGKSCPSGLLSFPFSIMNPYHVTNHFVYFKNAAERDEFIQNAKAEGFQLEQSSDNGEAERPYFALVSREDSVTFDNNYATAMLLIHLAENLNGDYDGSETLFEMP